PLLGRVILQLKDRADLAAGAENHFPRQFGDFSGAKTRLDREQNNQTVAIRMPRAFGEKQEIVDVIAREYLGLFARHLVQIKLQADSSSFESGRNGNFMRFRLI